MLSPNLTRYAVVRDTCLSLILLAACLPRPGLSHDCTLHNPLTTLRIGTEALRIEIAATNTSRRCGLAFRDRLPANHGMLFVYRQAAYLPFWMKDTRIPLSIAFLDGDGRIVDIQHMTDTQGMAYHTSTQAVRFALEVNLGWFEAHHITIGKRAEFTLPKNLEID